MEPTETTKTKTRTTTKEELFDVDALARKKEIDTSVFAGVKMLKGWKKGKMVSEKEFQEAINGFLNTTC